MQIRDYERARIISDQLLEMDKEMQMENIRTVGK